jgi:hypothetical protein
VAVTGIDHVQVAAPPGREPEAGRLYGELLGMQEIENRRHPWGNRLELIATSAPR